MRPTSSHIPPWVTYRPDEVTTMIVKMANEGLTPSEIGRKLRDEYGIPLTKPLVGKKVLKILEEHKAKPALPEDLNRLLEKAKRLQSHLRAHKADKKNVRSLELLEAKIHRLSKYYKSKGLLPPDWKYAPAVAQLA